MNIQDWFPLGLTGLSSLQSKWFSRVFCNSAIQKYQFFCAQLSLWILQHINSLSILCCSTFFSQRQDISRCISLPSTFVGGDFHRILIPWACPLRLMDLFRWLSSDYPPGKALPQLPSVMLELQLEVTWISRTFRTVCILCLRLEEISFWRDFLSYEGFCLFCFALISVSEFWTMHYEI